MKIKLTQLWLICLIYTLVGIPIRAIIGSRPLFDMSPIVFMGLVSVLLLSARK